MNPSYTEFQWELESKNILSNRISNIAITIDKVKHCLKWMGTNEAPLRTLTYREIFSKFSDGETSFRANLFKLIDKLEDWASKEICHKLFWKVADISITTDMNECQCRDQYLKVLDIIRQLSFEIRNFKSRIVFTEALADILYMFSNTFTYFTQTESYKKFVGEEVSVRRWEVTCNPNYRDKIKNDPFLSEEEKIVFRGAKEYDPSYIWGQLSGWYKQSVDKPNASLSADRRGTLSIPDLDSFDLQKPIKKSRRPPQKKNNKDYAYDKEIDEFSDNESGLGKRIRSKKKATTTSLHLPSVNEEEEKSRKSRGFTPNPHLRDDDLPQIPIIDSEQTEIDKELDELRSYPLKKTNKRSSFLETLKESFSKQWDIVSKWNFKNKQKIYGSIQFESLVKSGINNDKNKLQYFQQIIDELLSFEEKENQDNSFV